MTNETLTKPDPLVGPRTSPTGEKFPWGVIDQVHAVGPYQIVEFRWDASRGGRSMWPDHGRTMFHAYVDGEDTAQTFDDLDAALAGAIAYRAEGANSKAAEYFMRMIGQG